MLDPAQIELFCEVMRYFAVAFAMGFGAIGAAIGEGHTAGIALAGSARQRQPGIDERKREHDRDQRTCM